MGGRVMRPVSSEDEETLGVALKVWAFMRASTIGFTRGEITTCLRPRGEDYRWFRRRVNAALRMLVSEGKLTKERGTGRGQSKGHGCKVYFTPSTHQGKGPLSPIRYGTE
jgi:hypothetical protein